MKLVTLKAVFTLLRWGRRGEVGEGLMKKEPVLIGAVVTILATLAAGYGLDLTAEQLSGAISVVIALVGLMQRSRVSPT